MVPAPTPDGVPVITSNKGGGITTRHAPVAPVSKPPPVDGHSAALLDKVRSLDHLPRLGALQTLDLRGNDLRVCLAFCGIAGEVLMDDLGRMG